MATAESLSSSFEEYGFELSADIIAKCKFHVKLFTHITASNSPSSSFVGLELCIDYDVSDPKDFVENYVAFSVNHLNGAEPTNDSLADFERKELKQSKAKVASNRNQPKHRNQINDYEQYEDVGMDDEGDDLMDAYICNTPKVSYYYYSRNFGPIFYFSSVRFVRCVRACAVGRVHVRISLRNVYSIIIFMVEIMQLRQLEITSEHTRTTTTTKVIATNVATESKAKLSIYIYMN